MATMAVDGHQVTVLATRGACTCAHGERAMFQSMLEHTPKLACSRMRHTAAYAGAPVPFILRGSERERCDHLSIRGQVGARHLAGSTTTAIWHEKARCNRLIK